MAISPTQLTQLYLAYFGRPPDPSGMNHYTADASHDVWTVAAAFSASAESGRLYGGDFGPEAINAIYQNLFNRDAEAEGITYWLGEVAAGRLTPAGVAYAILLGAQNEDALQVAGKLDAATAFYLSLDTPEEVQAYAGDAAAAAARELLAAVGRPQEPEEPDEPEPQEPEEPQEPAPGEQDPDDIYGGNGSDALLLSTVGAGNAASFRNFERFDAKGLAKTFDMDLLAAFNPVDEIVATGDVAGGALVNLGAGVSFRALASTSLVSLTQKVPGPLAVMVDVDEKAGTKDGANAHTVSVLTSNATSLQAVFDADYVEDKSNTATLNLTGSAAATLSVSSGGTYVTNTLNHVYGLSEGVGVLQSVTVTGARALALNLDASGGSDADSAVSLVDATAHSGGLQFSLADLKDGGAVALGSGADRITVTLGGSVEGGMESVLGFEIADAAALEGAAAAIAVCDMLRVSGVVIAAADEVSDGSAGVTIGDGVAQFTGVGPTTLQEAIAMVEAETDPGEMALFQYVSDSYLYVDGGTVVKLAGLTGVAMIGAVSADLFLLG